MSFSPSLSIDKQSDQSTRLGLTETSMYAVIGADLRYKMYKHKKSVRKWELLSADSSGDNMLCSALWVQLATVDLFLAIPLLNNNKRSLLR